MNKDKCIKALALNETIRVYVLKNTNTINEAIKKHNLWPSSASVLGKLLSMGQMMGHMLKGNEALTIKVSGNGYLGKAIIDANSKGEVRGYVDEPHLNFINSEGGINDLYAIGNEGIIEVIKDLKMKETFTSSIALTGNIASDFTYYFYESEQSPSLVSLGITINEDNQCSISGGIIIQVLPNASDSEISFIESKTDILTNFSDLLNKYNAEEILYLLFENNYKILDEVNVSFKCSCSKESFSRSLLTLGSQTLQEILNEDEHIETKCFYCNSKYDFNKEEIKLLINEAKRQNK